MCASPRSNAAGQTRLPTFSISSRLPSAASSCASACADHVRVEMAALAGVDLHRRARRSRGCGRRRARSAGRPRSPRPACGRRSASIVRTSSVVLPEPGLDTRFSAKMPRSARARRFCAAIRVVLGEDVLLDLHDARRRHAGACVRRADAPACAAAVRVLCRRRAVDVPCARRRARAPCHRARAGATCRASALVRARADAPDRLAVDPRFAVAAAAGRAHVSLLRRSAGEPRPSASRDLDFPDPHRRRPATPELVAAAARAGVASRASGTRRRRTACTTPRPASSRSRAARPSATLPRVTASKQKRSASGSTCDSAPISSRTGADARARRCARAVVLDDLAARLRRAPSHAWPTSIRHATQGSSACTASRARRSSAALVVRDAGPRGRATSAPVGMEIPLGRRDDLVVGDAAVGDARAVQQQPARGLHRGEPFAGRERECLRSSGGASAVAAAPGELLQQRASSASRATMRVATALPSRAAAPRPADATRMRASAPVSTGAPSHVGARANSGCSRHAPARSPR